MKVLVTGATGNVGSLLVNELKARGTEVRVLTRKEPAPDIFPAGIEVAVGDMLDPASIKLALQGVDKVFLLNALSPAELTEALIVLGMAKHASVQHICYLSMFKADVLRDVPHAAAKYAVERALGAGDLPFTVLRPNYFIQNEARLMPVIEGTGFYPVPLGAVGVSAVDIRDIAEAAAITLTQPGHFGQVYNLVGPEPLKGTAVAELWSQLLGKKIMYAGDDVERWAQLIQARMPGWLVFDIRSMWEAFHEYAYAADEGDIVRFTALLGHAPRRYESFIREIVS